MNVLFSKDISLNRDTHTYTLKSKPTAKFISTTTIVHSLFAPFEKEKIAANLVAVSPKYASFTKEELMALWDKSGTDGTKVHNELEAYIKNRIPVTEIKAHQGVKWINQFDQDKYDWYPEVIIYSEELGISGTIDLLIYNVITKVFIIIDWKTNEKIVQTAFRNKKGISIFSKNIPDSNYWHYVFQLGIYRHILENYYGKNIKTQAIIHLQNDIFTEYELPYLKREIDLLVASIK